MADQNEVTNENELKREPSDLEKDWIEIVKDANGILISVHNHSQYTLERVKDRELFPNDLKWAKEPLDLLPPRQLTAVGITVGPNCGSGIQTGSFCYRVVASLNQESSSNLRIDNNNNTLSNMIDFTFSMEVEGSTIKSSEANAVISSESMTVMQGYVSQHFGLKKTSNVSFMAAPSMEIGFGIFSKRVQFEEITTLNPPLIVFVNCKSGGKQGKALLSKFKQLLPPEQVFDIIKAGGPRAGLERYKHVPNLKILACGGDGTGRWVLETLDKMEFDDDSMRPAVGVLPLGTGNDIGRVLGWGGGYNGEDLNVILKNIIEADTVNFDRWRITITPRCAQGSSSNFNEPSAHGTDSNTDILTTVMNNYLSIGFADAQIALNFHQMRESNPGLFFNRGVNKFWYVTFGAKTLLQDMVSTITNTSTKMSEIIDIAVDGNPVIFPDELEGVVVLNLPSYAGGMNLWGTMKDNKYKHVSFNDGVLEVIGIRSSLHLGEIGTGLSTGIRLGQGSKIKITYKQGAPPLPGKIDGEPWLQKEPATYEIEYWNLVKMLCLKNSVASNNNTETHKSGWLNKQGGQLPYSWKVRWFVLNGNKLYYYITTQDKTPRGVINLPEVSVCLATKYKNCLEIKTSSRYFYISAAETKESAPEWMEALIKAGAKASSN